MDNEVRPRLDHLLDSGGFGRGQVAVVVLCALVAMVDGFDTQSIALVAPDIAAEWGAEPAAFGVVFGVGLFGGLIGAIFFGFAGDRYGRKPTLLVAMAVFAVCSSLTPLANSLTLLGLLRLVTGFGLGGALPCIIAITSEYTPARMRATVVGLMFCGFPLGAVAGGLGSAWLIPAFGWGSVFLVGGVVPILLLPLLWARLPESARFLALTGDQDALRAVLRRLGIAGGDDAVEPEPEAARPSVVRLFTERRAGGTLLLWATLFLSLLLTYLLTNWIPLLARQSGIDAASAIFGVVALNLGAVVGCLVIGRLADRSRPTVVIGSAFSLGAVAIAAIGHTGGSAVALLVVSFLAGSLSVGAQMCTVALCASFYETSVRATGIGWAVGIGRIGGIAGPLLGGLLVTLGVGTPDLFLVTGSTSLGAAVAVFALARFLTRAGRKSVLSAR
ncbi:MFS transporter [Amycolatopsis sp.]|jgi:AAHS family 4-hydroxybenzoate transporter-like MFS transporter|uniref:MFS transporter n=1 Tax=Amycolatopsis sp. TaxID=37632 RepID=UPI002DFFE86D|nr:MFS transporter [Amycolatopsis sp.]